MWWPFDYVGRLTKDGIQFIEENLTNLEMIDFETYRQRGNKK